jgi:hypothetical protein
MKRLFSFPPFLSFLLYLALAGCGGSSPGTQGPTLPFSSGLYQITGTSNSNASSNFTLAGSLMQSGNSVSGVMHITLPACFSFSTDIPVSGTLSTNNTGDFTVALALTLPGGQNLSFSTVHPGGHLSSIAGTYSLTGAGCAAPDQGLASGNIMSVTGSSWVGTLVSIGGTTSHISLALTQTGPDAHGFFSATGTATITGGTCFTGASVDPASVVIGAGSQLIMDNSQVGTAGKLTLQGVFSPLPFGGATFAGAYTSTQGACSDSGTASMTFS